jgi:hypothetical protein
MMLKVRSLVGVAAALIATPLMGLPAWASACVPGTVGDYTTAGFSCSVGPVTFSNIAVTVTTVGTGSVAFPSPSPPNFAFTIFNNGTDFGLNLNYSASAPNPGDRADISWTYNVTSTSPLSDALAALSGTATGTGTIALSETFIPNVGNIQIGPNQIGGSQIISLSPQLTSLSILKDQADHANVGTAQTSIMTNAFSVVPAPVVGAGLPGLAAACGGLIGLARRRRRQIA